VCDYNNFCTGSTPAQTVAKVVPYAMNKWGKKVYIVAADYNYGQIIAQWMQKFVRQRRRDAGGRVLPARRHQLWPDHQQDPAGQADIVFSRWWAARMCRSTASMRRRA
jgi:hypothetical protein